MQLTVKQSELAAACGIVARALSSRTTLSILGNILLDADASGILTLASTNLEIAFCVTVPARVDEAGAVTVPGKLFTDLAASLPDDTVALSTDERGKKLTLKCLRDEARFNTIDAADFPIVPAFPDEGDMALDADTLKRVLDFAAFAAAKDPSRPVLTSVHCRIWQSGVTLEATDGFRLSVSETHDGITTQAAQRALIPARTLTELGKLLKPGEAVRAHISQNRNQVMFQVGSVTLVSQLIDGVYPDVYTIMPKSAATRVVVDTRALRQLVKRTILFAKDGSNIVQLDVTPPEPGLDYGTLAVSGKSTEYGDAAGELDAAVEGTPLSIAFNGTYLQDALEAVKTAQVVMEFGTPASPGIIKPMEGGFTHVIMPMHISR